MEVHRTSCKDQAQAAKDAEYKVLWSKKLEARYRGWSIQGNVGVAQTYLIFELENNTASTQAYIW